MEPFPSHPDILLISRTGKRRRIHLVKWHQMTIRVDIPALLEQVLGNPWGVENDYYLTENSDGHDLACDPEVSAERRGVLTRPTILPTPLSEREPNKTLWKGQEVAD